MSHFVRGKLTKTAHVYSELFNFASIKLLIYTNMDELHLDLTFPYSDISEVKKGVNKQTIIHFNNGDRLTFTGERGKQILKKLLRNFPAEHLD